MSNWEWKRPGIVPGLQENSYQIHQPLGERSLGCVADSHDCKTYPEVREVSQVRFESQLANKQSVKPSGDLLIRKGKIMDSENMCSADILIKDGKIRAIGVNLDNNMGVPEIDANNLVISSGLVDFSASSHAFNGKDGIGGMADEVRIREATSRAVLAGVTTIVDTVYGDDGHSPVSAVAAYLQVLQTTHVNCNIIVRAGIRHLTLNTISDIELLSKRHHIKSFLLSIPENDRILSEKGCSESTVLFGILSVCRGLGIIPTIGLDKITGTQMPKTDSDPELRVASVAIAVAKLAGCPIVLSPVRNVAVMHKIYTAQREYPPLFIYADFAVNAFVDDCMKDQAPYIAADGNIIISSGESYLLPNDLQLSESSWILKAYENILSRGWANERHITGASCKRPAQLVGIYPQKGHLVIGADADIVLWSANDRSKPVFTLVGGRIIVQYGRLWNTNARDREEGNAVKIGFLPSGQTPASMLIAMHEMMKSLGKALQTPPEEEMTVKLENKKLGPSGDLPLAGLPTIEMRSIASRYKQESLSSSIQLTDEKQGDDQPTRLHINVSQAKLNSTCPY